MELYELQVWSWFTFKTSKLMCTKCTTILHISTLKCEECGGFAPLNKLMLTCTKCIIILHIFHVHYIIAHVSIVTIVEMVSFPKIYWGSNVLRALKYCTFQVKGVWSWCGNILFPQNKLKLTFTKCIRNYNMTHTKRDECGKFFHLVLDRLPNVRLESSIR